MSVVWQAKCRLCRRAAQKLYLKGERCHTRKCAIEKESRNKPPGQHGDDAGRRRLTEFATQLIEKQKLKRMYLLRERQFSSYMKEASRRRGVTGENLLQLLEMRLDNAIFRLGWTTSRSQARQLVSHRFFNVNGRRVNIPSYQVRTGDVIGMHESKREKTYTVEALKTMATVAPPGWLEINTETFEGKVLRAPERDDIKVEINEQLIVEYYTR